MKVKATEIKNHLGKYLKMCAEEDIYITKNDKIIAKLVKYNDVSEGHVLVTEKGAAYSYSGNKISYEEFLKITEGNEERYEYIDGKVFLLASPGMIHQIIHSNLYKKLILWFEGKKCRVFSAPFDVTLYNEETKSKNVVQPDLLVTCDHKESTNSKDRYMGIPSLVIEIQSPQTRSRDMVKKLNVYLEGGVNEYWIVDPQERQVIQYHFTEKQPCRIIVNQYTDTIKSLHFKGLEIAVADIFEEAGI
ncbi:MAG: Uma2 family endonuclease [Firmicutes bacterium]|nr:Uma2 family endonuclease [Bacillota bacterium]